MAETTPETKEQLLARIRPEGTIIPEKAQLIRDKFESVITSTRFWASEGRVKLLETALVIPRFDDTSFRKLFEGAENDLIAENMKTAIESSSTPVMPTEEQIINRAYERHLVKVAEAKAKAEKKAKTQSQA